MRLRHRNKFNLRKFVDMVTIAAFLLAISLPPAIMLMTDDASASVVENRTLAQAPDWQTLMTAPFASAIDSIETYLQDHFGFREQLIWLHNQLQYQVLQQSPTDRVLLGNDGWLYYTSSIGIGTPLTGFRRFTDFSEDYLACVADRLTARQDMLAQENMRYYIVIAPDKKTIYPEHLPTAFTLDMTNTRADQLVSYLSAYTDLTVIDLRPVLIERKSTELLYEEFGTHWNALGAFYGYQEIMRVIREDFPELPVITQDAFAADLTWEKRSVDLANIIGMNGILQENLPDYRPQTSCAELVQYTGPELNSDRPAILYQCPSGAATAIMFRDSFSTLLLPLLAQSFQQSLYQWDYVNEDTAINLVLEHQGTVDIVIEQIVERNLGNAWMRVDTVLRDPACTPNSD